jgi:GTP cyclohydrolase I
MVKALRDMTAGYSADLGALLKTTFTEPYDQIVVVRNIPFWSLCEHHVLPFHGEVSIGYLPDGHVVGLSKLPRLVRALSRRLQVQERLTQQIALAIQEHLNPRGVGVVVTAEHTCMQMRGVESHGSMRTSEVLGLFRDSATVRAEFLRLVGC